MAGNAERLRRGEVDVIQVFEPYVDQEVAGGWGHVWHRFAWRGDMSYTSFYTTRQIAAAERETWRVLVRGTDAAQGALSGEAPDEIAGHIATWVPAFEPGAEANTSALQTQM